MSTTPVLEGQPLFNHDLDLGTISLAEAWDEARLFMDSRRPVPNRLWQNGPLLLRAHTIEESDHSSPDEVQAAAMEAQEHFRKLQELGMDVVSRRLQTVDAVTVQEASPPHNNQTMVAVTGCRFIDAYESLGTIQSARSLRAGQRIEKEIVRPLQDYVTLCVEENLDIVLRDIFSLDQYGWHPDTDTIFLGDIDPQEETLEEFEELVGVLDPSHISQYFWERTLLRCA